MSNWCYDCTWQNFGIDPRKNDFAVDREPGEILIALCEGCGYVAQYDEEGKRVVDPGADHLAIQRRVEPGSAGYPWALVDHDGNVVARYSVPDGAILHLLFEQKPRPNTPEFTSTPMITSADQTALTF